jgi:exodeoxyribonuclease III
MQIITVNVNGIRSAAKKGFFQWLEKQTADVVCLQEVRAHKDITDHEDFNPPGFYCYYCDAEKKGYSGVAIFTRQKPDKVSCSLGIDLADREGRYIQVDFANLSVASIYLPSGSSGDERQADKIKFLEEFYPILQNKHDQEQDFVICGDINIVHKDIDIKNWKSNQKRSGCLPEERAWLDRVFAQGWVDAFRAVDSRADQYTWWSNRGRAWDNNVGWRIDYQWVSSGLADKIDSAHIYKDERFSDHAPLLINFEA